MAEEHTGIISLVVDNQVYQGEELVDDQLYQGEEVVVVHAYQGEEAIGFHQQHCSDCLWANEYQSN